MQYGFLGPDQFESSGSNYPLTVPTAVSPFLEDLAIDTSLTTADGLRVTWIAGIGEADADLNVPTKVNRFDMLIQNEMATILWDTRQFEYHEYEFGAYYIGCWSRDDTVIQAVIKPDVAAKSGYRLSGAAIDSRSVTFRSRPVIDFEIWNGDEYVSTTAHLDHGKVLRLRRGYNTNLTTLQTRTTRGEIVQDVTVDIVPGAGIGRFPACDANLGISALGGAKPTEAGDLIITGDDCLRFQPKVTYDIDGATVVDGQFTLEDICQAGCQCEDFTELAKYTTATWNRMREIATRANEIRNQYHSIRDHMAAVKECAEKQPLRLEAWPIRPCEMAVMVGVCNPGDENMEDITVQLDIKTTDDEPIDDAIVHCDSIYRVDHESGKPLPKPYSFESPMPGAQIKFKCIPPNSMGYVTFRLKLAQSEIPTTEESTTADPGPTTTATGPTTTPTPTTTAAPVPNEVKFCLFCPVGMPLPWKTPDELCKTVDVSCSEDKECGPTSDGTPTTTGTTVTTTGTTVTTSGTTPTTTGSSGPTTTGPITTTPDYLTKGEGDLYYINDEEVIDGGHF